MNYNYVFFDGSLTYNRIARSDLERLDNVIIIENDKAILSGCKIIKFCYRVHLSARLNMHKAVPFQSIWSKKLLGNIHFENEQPICFLFSGSFLRHFYDMKFFDYLKKRYKNCKVVLMLRDVVEVCLSQLRKPSISLLKNTFDVIYSINLNDVNKHGFKKINVMCSCINIPENHTIKESDIVFIGKKKDRMDLINAIYVKLTNLNIRCDFTVYNDDSDAFVQPGIRVIDKYMDYVEMLQRSVKAKCILEITHKNICSLSSRCLEAFCYNKKLITDVKEVKDSPFYNPNYIKIIDNIDDIDVDFINNSIMVDYKYNGYYSPINLINSIDKDLN